MWEGQLAVIARTNAALFNSMVDLCDQHDTYKFGFAGVSVREGGGLYMYIEFRTTWSLNAC